MKFKEIISRLEANPALQHKDVCASLFMKEALDLYPDYDRFDSEIDERFSSHWLDRHLCTDTVVGTRAFFLDGKFICLSTQLARKSPEDFSFASKEAFDRVYSLLLPYSDRVKPDFLPEEYSESEYDFYGIMFSGELLRCHEKAVEVETNEWVEIDFDKTRDLVRKNYIAKTAILKDGREIPLHKLKFPVGEGL